jgi:hypothetical protein
VTQPEQVFLSLEAEHPEPLATSQQYADGPVPWM